MENQNPWLEENNSQKSSSPESPTDTSPKPNSAINTERYAVLTGFAPSPHNSPDSTAERTEDNREDTDLTLSEDGDSSSPNPYYERTFHSFSSHPIPKIILVFGSVLVAVLMAGLILNSGSFQSTAQKDDLEEVTTLQTIDEPIESDSTELEKGELLTEIALAEQKKQLQALDSPQNQAKSTPKPSPPPDRPQTRPTPVTASTPAPQVIYRTVSVPAPTPVAPITPIQPTEPIKPPIDPQQAWIAATQIGNYGRVTSLSTQPQKDNPPALSPTTYNPASLDAFRERSLPTTSNSSRRILIGSTAKAVLVNSLVWESITDQRSLFFRLEESLNDPHGSVVIPQGAQIIASINGVAPSGAVDLTINSVLLSKQGNWQELPLPPDSLSIQGQKGRPLLAKSSDPSRSLDWSGLATEALGTAALETDLTGSRNLPRVIDRLSPSRSRYPRSNSIYWSLKKNTQVEILVARSFSWPLATKEKTIE